MKFRQKVEEVKAIPGQIRMTLMLAISALVVAFIAMAMAGMGARNAH